MHKGEILEQIDSIVPELGNKLAGPVSRYFELGQIMRPPTVSGENDIWIIVVNHIEHGKAYWYARLGRWCKTMPRREIYSPDINIDILTILKNKADNITGHGTGEGVEKSLELVDTVRKLWSQYSPAHDHPYIINKKVPSDTVRVNNKNLVIPIQNSEGELVAAQIISEQGKKLIYGPYKGAFHVVSGRLAPESSIVIAEGYATAATAAMFLPDYCVVAAMTGTNMWGVYEALKAKNIGKRFYILGEIGGENYYRKFYAATDAQVAIPKFSSSDVSLSDYNDLMVEEGEEVAKFQILEACQEIEKEIIPVGCNATDKGDEYWVMSVDNPSPRIIDTNFSKTALDLMPLNYWLKRYPKGKNMDMVDWMAAESDVKHACRSLGPFKSDRIRRSGLFKDWEYFYYNSGQGLFRKHENEYKWERVSYGSTRAKYCYVRGPVFPDLKIHEFDTQDFKTWVKALTLLRWEDPVLYPMLFVGWLSLVPVCGALPWRPHIWLTSPPHCGKSTIVDIAEKFLGTRAIKNAGLSSEASLLRQASASGVGWIHNEFEVQKGFGAGAFNSIMAFHRQSSTNDGAMTRLGVGSNKVSYYTPTHMAFNISVSMAFPTSADEQRFSQLNLSPGPRDGYNEYLKRTVGIDVEKMGYKMGNAAILNLDVILENYETLFKVNKNEIGDHYSRQYAMLLSGFYSPMLDYRKLTEKEADNIMNNALQRQLSKLVPANKLAESSIRILEDMVRMPGLLPTIEGYKMTTIQTLITMKDLGSLASMGIHQYGGYLAIKWNNPVIQKLLRESDFNKGWQNSLRQIQGSYEEYDPPGLPKGKYVLIRLTPDTASVIYGGRLALPTAQASN